MNSEEEILKDINNYISFSNKANNFSDINEYLHCKELARRLQGLLDLYNKEKEEANAISKPSYMVGVLDERNEWYKKIKEKIEKTQKECFLYEQGTKCENCMERCIVEGLQELLKE